MQPWWRKPLDRVALLLGATVLLTVVGQGVAPEPVAPTTTAVVPISSLALTCPSLPADTPGYAIALKAALREGSLRGRLALQARRPLNAVVQAGEVRTIAVRASSVGLVTAEGLAASQLVADASLTGTQTSTRGLATWASCANTPRSSKPLAFHLKRCTTVAFSASMLDHTPRSSFMS